MDIELDPVVQSTRRGSSPCVCDSGLATNRCCDLDPGYTVATEAIGTHDRLAAAVAEHDLATADRLCVEALDLRPRDPAILFLLARIRQDQGRRGAAVSLLQRLVQVAPNHIPGTQDLALLLFENGDLPAAEIHARNAIRLAPSQARSHNLIGMVLTESNRPHPGEYHYRRTLELSSERDPVLLANLAWNLKGQGRLAEARELYVESCAKAPNVFQTLLGWAQVEEADRRLDAASVLLDQAASIRTRDPGLRIAKAKVLGRRGDLAAALASVDDGCEEATGSAPGADHTPELLLEKGHILDRLGRIDEAFACFDQAKQIVRVVKGRDYQEQHAVEQAARLKQFFVRHRMALMPRSAQRSDAAQPIFILGFPRSGTTLTEQVLSSHPQIAAGDELPFMNELGDRLPNLLASPLSYPEALSELWMGDKRRDLDGLRDDYLHRARCIGIDKPGGRWFTDKMPLNETHIGLISLIFPSSPMIHVIRHPLDVVLSVFSHQMTHGLNCANALETIARHYVLTMDLVEHYKANLDLRYLALRYEDMIADMPGSVRLMSEFIGVPFDSRCVDFHENRRLPQTPSYAQVSEKLYDRSRYRYRAYRHHLEPVIPILKPVISRLGYVIEAATDDNPAASHGAGTAARNAAARLDAPPSAAAMFG